MCPLLTVEVEILISLFSHDCCSLTSKCMEHRRGVMERVCASGTHTSGRYNMKMFRSIRTCSYLRELSGRVLSRRGCLVSIMSYHLGVQHHMDRTVSHSIVSCRARIEQGRLAKWLVDNSCADRVFFCNSGAEANEAAIKVLFSLLSVSTKFYRFPFSCSRDRPKGSARRRSILGHSATRRDASRGMHVH